MQIIKYETINKSLTLDFQLSGFIVFCAMMGMEAHAALPPQYAALRYQQSLEKGQVAREHATDQVKILISQHLVNLDERDRCPQILSSEVEAEVLSAKKGNLKAGDKLKLTYQASEYFCPGAGSYNPRPLEPRQVIDAYLDCEDKNCTPSSLAWSFYSEQEFAALQTEAKRLVEKYTDPRLLKNSALQQRVVYFEYDQLELDEKAQKILNAHASFLQSHPSAKLRLFGYSDDAKSREAEFELGKKRAEIVRSYLKKMGVADNQFEDVTSFGRDEPCTETEVDGKKASLKLIQKRTENRRVVLVYMDLPILDIRGCPGRI